MTTRKRVAHTASFLQTFHTGQTTAARREAAGAEGSEPFAAPADAEAVAFVMAIDPGKTTGVTFAQPTRPGFYFAEYRGVKVLHGNGMLTEPQAKYVVGIALDREGVTDEMLESLKVRLEQGFAKYAASQFITRYKDLPRKAAPATTSAPEKVTEDGIYVDRETGRIFKVQRNKAQGTGTRLYAKQLSIEFTRNGEREEREDGLLDMDFNGVPQHVNGKPQVQMHWEYVSGLVYRIKPEWRLRPEQAKEWGVLYGSCVRCHRDLTKEESIGRMMGDTCASRQGF
jgi:hypothetical protein